MPQSWPSSWLSLYMIFIVMFFGMVIFMYFSSKNFNFQSSEANKISHISYYYWTW